LKRLYIGGLFFGVFLFSIFFAVLHVRRKKPPPLKMVSNGVAADQKGGRNSAPFGRAPAALSLPYLCFFSLHRKVRRLGKTTNDIDGSEEDSF
jgi:hypothetical protein